MGWMFSDPHIGFKKKVKGWVVLGGIFCLAFCFCSSSLMGVLHCREFPGSSCRHLLFVFRAHLKIDTIDLVKHL